MRRHLSMLVVILVLTAGCGGSTQPTAEPPRNASLSLSGYERTESASPVDTRLFWDRSKNWEDPGNRTVKVTSRTHTYRNLDGTDAVTVYTTPRKRYVGADSVRSLSAPDLADLATRPVETPPIGNDTGPTFRAPLFDEEVTVWTLTDAGENATGHVARIVHENTIVVVVVTGVADRETVERVLGSVTFNRSAVG